MCRSELHCGGGEPNSAAVATAATVATAALGLEHGGDPVGLFDALHHRRLLRRWDLDLDLLRLLVVVALATLVAGGAAAVATDDLAIRCGLGGPCGRERDGDASGDASGEACGDAMDLMVETKGAGGQPTKAAR